jgi:enoyl-CoA hydratase/carnithine racemase
VSYETLTVERERPDDPIVRIWLNRPERRNALSGRALEEIAACFGALRTDFTARVVVLGGRGPSFCAGADRKDPPGARGLLSSSDATERERRWLSQIGLRAVAAIEACDVPTIARIHGHAVGGGLALAAACDFRIAAHGTIFHVPEVDLGIPLSWGATPRLVHEIGAARARELILMCEPVETELALAWGLLHRAVSVESLDATVDEWARRLAAKPEIAVHMTKTQLRSYALRARLGDVTETDGDVLREASRGAVARASFPRK